MSLPTSPVDPSEDSFDRPEGIPHDSHTADMVDHYWGTMQNVQGLIKASELKAGLLLSFYGILLNFIYQSASNVLETSTSDLPIRILGSVWILTTSLSIWHCVRCFIPRIEGRYDANIFFFGDVISKFGDIKAFAKTFHRISIDERQLFLQLGEQIFILSKIASWKFRNVNRAIQLLAASLGVLLLMVLWVLFAH